VEEEFTTRQILRVIGFAGVYMCLATVLVCLFYLYVLHPSPVGASSPFAVAADLAVRWDASPELRGAVGIWLLGMVAMSGLFAIATGVVFSRRLAGPLHRLKSDLAAIAAGGELRPISLREGDELQDLAEVTNAALSSLEERSRVVRAPIPSEQEVERLDVFLSSMRSHVARLEALTLSGTTAAAVESWLVGMHDLLEKVERSGEL